MRGPIASIPFEPNSILRLAGGERVIYLRPTADGAQVAGEEGVRVLTEEETAGATIELTPLQLAQAEMRRQIPGKVVTLTDTGESHVAHVQVGPNPEVFVSTEAPTAEEALANLVEHTGLVEVQR